MIKRLWLVLSVLWALFGFWAAASGQRGVEGIRSIDWFLIAAPFLIGPVVWRLGRFVVRGD